MTTATDQIVGLNGFTAWKPPARVATTANITLSGEQTIDGIAVVSGDRVLVKDQTDATENGIWVAATGAWTRAADFNGARDVVYGTSVLVMTGTANALKPYALSTTSPVVGTSSLGFAELSWAETYSTRNIGNATLLAANPDGTIGWMDGLPYEADSTKTGTASATNDISVNGLKPFGKPYADHYGNNATPGTTDMATAINACISNNGECNLFAVDYAVGSTIVGDNAVLQGANAQGSIDSRLLGLSASLAAGDPIVALGRSSVIERVAIEYDSLTGSETEDQRIGLDTSNTETGTTYNMQRGAKVDQVLIKNCGTGIGDQGAGGFSIAFGAIEILNFSYAGVDMRATSSTGNTWENVYISGSVDTYSAPKYGFNCESNFLGSIDQMNVEHQAFSEAAVRFSSMEAGSIDTLHIEGVDVTADDKSYLELSESNLDIQSLTMINTRVSNDNLALIRLKTAGTSAYTDGSDDSLLTIGVWNTRAIAAPNSSLYPGYSGYSGVANSTGLQFVGRASSFTDKDYGISVAKHEWGRYAAAGSDSPYYQYALERHSNENDNIDVIRFGPKGTRSPRPNFVENGAFDSWADTSQTGVTTAHELATGWYIEATTGTIDGSQQDDDYGRDNAYFLRFDTTGSAGNFQGAYHNIGEWQQLLDSTLVLSFDMKASVAGRRLEQISMSLINSGGTPTSIYDQVWAGSDSLLDATTSWRRYEKTFESVASSGLTAPGSAPVFKLLFQVNDSSGSRESQIDIRNVKLERGTIASSFSRHRND